MVEEAGKASGIEKFVGTTIGIRAWVEDFWKSKRSQSTQDEKKKEFSLKVELIALSI